MTESPDGLNLEQSQREDDERRAAAEPASEGYTGEPCTTCGRIRVFPRRDGQLQCEKCESIQDAP